MFNRNMFQRILLWNAAVFSSITLMGCAGIMEEIKNNVSLTPEKTAQYVKAPQVYDIYAVKCSDMAADLNDPKFPYCLAQITAIAPNKTTFVLTDLFWKTAEDAVDTLRKTDLNGYSNVYFYRYHPITVSPASVEKLYAQKKIFAIRRLSESETAEFVTQVLPRPY